MRDDDEIRLTVPPDADLRGVVVAAVAAVVRRSGLGDAEVTKAREEAADAFATVIERGRGEVVTLTATASRHAYRYELHREGCTEVREHRADG